MKFTRNLDIFRKKHNSKLSLKFYCGSFDTKYAFVTLLWYKMGNYCDQSTPFRNYFDLQSTSSHNIVGSDDKFRIAF